MKIKNLLDHAIYVGYKGIRPGFTLEPGQISKELPPTLCANQRLKLDVERGNVQLVMNDSDHRTLGTKPARKPVEAPKQEEKPVEVPAEPAPAPEVEPEPEEVEEEEVTTTDEPEEEPEEVVEEPEEEEEEPEEEGFSLPKAASKMNKSDWLKVGLDEPLNMQNEIDPTMTKSDLRDAIEARIKELGL